jgi:hypothetical protein
LDIPHCHETGCRHRCTGATRTRCTLPSVLPPMTSNGGLSSRASSAFLRSSSLLRSGHIHLSRLTPYILSLVEHDLVPVRELVLSARNARLEVDIIVRRGKGFARLDIFPGYESDFRRRSEGTRITIRTIDLAFLEGGLESANPFVSTLY